MDPLTAFGRVDFDWTVNQTGVWRDTPHDVPEIHADALSVVFDHYVRLEGERWNEPTDLPANPPGAVIVGNAGVGKTHLMGRLRRDTIDRGGTFLLADLTDVRDFWDTVLQGAVSSLTRRLPGGGSQLERIIDAMLKQFGDGVLTDMSAAQLCEIRPPALSNRIDELVRSIQIRDRRRENVHYAPVLRALLLLANSEPNVLQLGEAWMSGLDVREESQMVHALPRDMAALDRLTGIIWWAHFQGPTVVAVDQIDAIASEARAAETGGTNGPETIFARATNGLMGLWEKLPRTQVVLSCLEANWLWIQEQSLESVQDRFDEPIRLRAQPGSRLQALIEGRLEMTYAKEKFTPPYPSFPFRTSCFEGLNLSPRVILRRAEEHRRHCQRTKKVEGLSSFPETGQASTAQDATRLAILDAVYESFCAAITPSTKLEGEDEELDRLLEAGVRALAHEQASSEGLDVELDLDFGRNGKVEPLHARIRVINHDDGDRERHLSLRFVQHDHHIAVQTRLQKALTESGLGEGLPFRRLSIFRRKDLPTGPKTKKMVAEVEKQGGSIIDPTDDEIRALSALHEMFTAKTDGLHEWLAVRKPVSKLRAFEDHVHFLFPPTKTETQKPKPNRPRLLRETRSFAQPTLPGIDAPVVESSSQPVPAPNLTDDLQVPQAATPAVVPKPPAPAAAEPPNAPIQQDAIPLGAVVVGRSEGPTVALKVDDLPRHMAVLAAAGSGKTVFLRRIVEEAACRGIPALVIDVANDLVRLGQPWPSPPPGFEQSDSQMADRYFSTSETVVWTPGRSQGNPLSVDPLPDFEPLLESPDELHEAQTMARELLAADLRLGSSASAETQKAILQRAIEAYARQGGKGLEDLLLILKEPGPLVDGFTNGAKQSEKLADALTAQMALNPMLRSDGKKLDFDQLFARGAARTRVSVVNLSGLATIELQQAFVGRLATLLFTYAKKHPGPQNGLGGLVVIDEAKDFVPAGRSVASSQPILRLAAQLRKYRFGLLVATQEPKSIDNKVVANCSTQIFGRALAPATQDAVKAMMAQLGGAAPNIGSLQMGQFYASVPNSPLPQKIRSRWCLSHHGGPATPDEVRAMAAADRERLGID